MTSVAVMAQHRILSEPGHALHVLCSVFCHPPTRQPVGQTKARATSASVSLSRTCLGEAHRLALVLRGLEIASTPTLSAQGLQLCRARQGQEWPWVASTLTLGGTGPILAAPSTGPSNLPAQLVPFPLSLKLLSSRKAALTRIFPKSTPTSWSYSEKAQTPLKGIHSVCPTSQAEGNMAQALLGVL